MCLRHNLECGDRANDGRAILEAAVRVAIGEVHVPREITVILGATPVGIIGHWIAACMDESLVDGFFPEAHDFEDCECGDVPAIR